MPGGHLRAAVLARAWCASTSAGCPLPSIGSLSSETLLYTLAARKAVLPGRASWAELCSVLAQLPAVTGPGPLIEMLQATAKHLGYWLSLFLSPGAEIDVRETR